MEQLIPFLFCCLGPLAIFLFGYWVGRGAPGWPWTLARRDPAAQRGYANGRTPASYYEDEEVFRP